MMGRANFGNADNDISLSASIIDLHAQENILLVSARPSADGKGILLHFRETEGKKAKLDNSKLLQNPNTITSVTEVNVLGKKINELEGRVLFAPNETKFLLLE